MRLVVNAVRLTRPFTGVGRYLLALLREWSALDLPFEEVTLVAPGPLHENGVFPAERYRLVLGGPAWPDPFWEWWTLGARARGSSLLFSPSYTLPSGYRGRAVVTHFGPATNSPGSFESIRAHLYDRLYRASARRAVRVLTASSLVKERIVRAYAVPGDRVEVIPLAPDPAFRPVEDPHNRAAVRRRTLGQDSPYVLFVGKLSGRHLIPRLIEAFARARESLVAPPRLLLVGPNVLGLDVAACAQGHGVRDLVVHVPHLTEEDLPALYSDALGFVYPATEAEGFGLPLVEAMACGAPVLSTALGSVPEVTGGAALLVPTNDAQTWAAALRRLIEDAALREDLRRRGLARARAFSWRTTAERTMAILREAAGPPPSSGTRLQ